MAIKNLLEELKEYHTKYQEELHFVHQTVNFLETYPDAFERTQILGHITASAYIIDRIKAKVFLMHHKKLNKWLQPGGHCDGEKNTLKVAKKEVLEETGLVIDQADCTIFDVDIHTIPKKNEIIEHLHYDIRYLFEVNSEIPFIQNHESLALAWIDLTNLPNVSNERSILRMAEKAFNVKY